MSSTIREFIGQDLKNRLGTGAGPPAELSLKALSVHYGVSLTPVREAVRDLVALGVLQRQENGRLRVGKVSTRTAQAPHPLSNSRILEEQLAAEIIARSLRRETDYLREEATAERFGVGRTAIREAFGRLGGRGLLVHVPRCGWRVRVFDEAELNAYLEVREILEIRALELAQPGLREEDLRQMLAGNSGQAAINNDLHRYLVEKSGNPFIRDFFDRHGPYYSSLFDYAGPETHEVVEMARQHREILQALLDRRWDEARRGLIEHIRAQKSIVGNLLGRLAQPNTSSPSEKETRR